MVTINDLLSVDKYQEEMKKTEDDLRRRNEELKELREKQASEQT